MTSLLRKFGAFLSAVAALAACTLPLAAQSTTPPTCTTPPASVATFSIERAIQFSDILSTLTPNIPANILAAIKSGAQEIRSRIVYNPTQGTLTDTSFLVPAGSPNPTPLSTDITQQTILGWVFNIDKVYTSCNPTPSIMFVGVVSSSNPAPFGNLSGVPGALSFGYTTDSPPKFNNVVTLAAGSIVAYSATATGTLTFPASPVTPPTTPGVPNIVINPVPVTPGSLQVFFNPYHVDASQSTDPNKLALKYMWSSDKPVNFQPSNTDAAPNIQFGSGAGDYTITLTVTNSAGVSSTTKFVLTYLGQH